MNKEEKRLKLKDIIFKNHNLYKKLEKDFIKHTKATVKCKDTIFADAFYSGKYVKEINFLNILSKPDDFNEKLGAHFEKCGFKDYIQKTLQYRKSLNYLIEFLKDENTSINIETKKEYVIQMYKENMEKNKDKVLENDEILAGVNKNIEKSNKKNKPKDKNQSEQPFEITQRTKDRIILINDICENNNKEPIFINDSETLKLWRAIEKLCTSEEIFINFTLQLYILIYETTRKENSEYKKNNGKPFYNYHLPFKFTKNGTPTKHFMDTVGALRHKFAHKKPEYNNVLIKKIEYKDVLKEIFDSKTPKSSEDFQKLQIEILKRLDNTLEILINIIENEYNSP